VKKKSFAQDRKVTESIGLKEKGSYPDWQEGCRVKKRGRRGHACVQRKLAKGFSPSKPQKAITRGGGR